VTDREIAHFIERFEAGTLPKAEWTHEGHLLVALWYLSRHPYDEALAIVRRRIIAHNEAVGTPNTDAEGYHETLTRLYLRGVAERLVALGPQPLPDVHAALVASPLADREWPLRFYTRGRLFSVEARRGWVAPDLGAGAR